MIAVLIFLQVLALHCSIAAMEIFSWATFAAVVGRRLYLRRRFTFPLAVPLLALVAVVLVSLLVNPSVRPFWLQLGFMRWVILLWGYYWAFEDFWDEKFETRLLKVWTSALVITACYACFQSLTGKDVIHTKAHLENLGMLWRATGFFSLTLTFGYVIGISFVSLTFPVRRLGRWFYLVAVFGPLAIIAAMSRGALFSVLLAALVGFALRARKYFAIALVAVIAGVFVMSKVSTRVDDTLHMRFENSTMERLHLWRAYLEMAKDHPFTGIGIFQGDKLLPEYYQRLGIAEGFTSHAHNVLIQWLAGTGVFGLALYLFLAFWFMRAAWCLRLRSPWGWSLLLAQVFWHLGSLSEANFFDGEVNHIIVFTWAILLYQTHRRKETA